MDKEQMATRLLHFTGTTSYYRHGLMRNMLLTDGTYWLSLNGTAWLLDIVASYQTEAHVKAEGFQHWKLTVDAEKRSGVVTMDDGRTSKELVRQEIEFTDFPLPELRLYMIEQEGDWVCLLPSEY